MSHKLMTISAVLTLLLSMVVGGVIAAPLPPPFDTEPFHTNGQGNSAANLFGSFRQDDGPGQLRWFIGTNITPGGLIMDFPRFTDGPGKDFAILTNSQSWGPLADRAQFEFFLDNKLQASLTASLAPDRLFQFELPGSGLVGDRIVVKNITLDPPGINDLATMTFDNAGIAHAVPIPSTLPLFILGALALFGVVQRRRKQEEVRRMM
jgi:hypothetical protein